MKKEKNKLPNIAQLEEMCKHISEQERKAQKVERESIKYMYCVYINEHIGQKFKAVISGVTDYGVYAEILENGCDGLISKYSLEESNLFIDKENFCVKDLDSKVTYRLGDEITVFVSGVDMFKKQIDFNIILN